MFYANIANGLVQFTEGLDLAIRGDPYRCESQETGLRSPNNVQVSLDQMETTLTTKVELWQALIDVFPGDLMNNRVGLNCKDRKTERGMCHKTSSLQLARICAAARPPVFHRQNAITEPAEVKTETTSKKILTLKSKPLAENERRNKVGRWKKHYPSTIYGRRVYGELITAYLNDKNKLSIVDCGKGYLREMIIIKHNACYLEGNVVTLVNENNEL